MDVLAAPAPDSPGDFAFIAATALVLVVLHFLGKTRSIRKDRARREQKIQQLMQESAAFAARWPGHRIAEAPFSELSAEHARSNRLLALLAHHRIASTTVDYQYVDSQIAAVQRWLASLPARVTDPTVLRPPACPPAATPKPVGPSHSAAASRLSPNGFPLGEPVLHLRGIPGADDIVCSVESVAYQQLAVIRPCGPAPWPWRDTTADAHFEVVRPDGAPLMYLNRFGGITQRLEAYDVGGYAIGTLRQTSSIWKAAGTQRLEFEMVFGGQRLGTTQVRRRSWSPNAEDPVHDATGQALALVEPVLPNPGEYRPSYNFTLHCEEPRPFPVAHLLLVIGFSHYLYSRTWR